MTARIFRHPAIEGTLFARCSDGSWIYFPSDKPRFRNVVPMNGRPAMPLTEINLAKASEKLRAFAESM